MRRCAPVKCATWMKVDARLRRKRDPILSHTHTHIQMHRRKSRAHRERTTLDRHGSRSPLKSRRVPTDTGESTKEATRGKKKRTKFSAPETRSTDFLRSLVHLLYLLGLARSSIDRTLSTVETPMILLIRRGRRRKHASFGLC